MKRTAYSLLCLGLAGLPLPALAQEDFDSIPLAVNPGAYCQQWTLLGLPAGNLRNPPEIVADGACTRHATISGFYTGGCTLRITAGTYYFFAKDLPRKPAFHMSADGLVLPLSRPDQEVLQGDLNQLALKDDGICEIGQGS